MSGTSITGSNGAELKVSKRGTPTRRRVDGPPSLNPRMRRMIGLMAHGHPEDPSGTRYGLFDAAEAVGYRRKAARELMKTAIFKDALEEALFAADSGARRAIPTLDQIRMNADAMPAPHDDTITAGGQVIAHQAREGGAAVGLARIDAPLGYVLDLTKYEDSADTTDDPDGEHADA